MERGTNNNNILKEFETPHNHTTKYLICLSMRLLVEQVGYDTWLIVVHFS